MKFQWHTNLLCFISSLELWPLGLVVLSGPGLGSLSTMAASCSCLLAAPATASPTLTKASMEARGSWTRLLVAGRLLGSSWLWPWYHNKHKHGGGRGRSDRISTKSSGHLASKYFLKESSSCDDVMDVMWWNNLTVQILLTSNIHSLWNFKNISKTECFWKFNEHD